MYQSYAVATQEEVVLKNRTGPEGWRIPILGPFQEAGGLREALLSAGSFSYVGVLEGRFGGGNRSHFPPTGAKRSCMEPAQRASADFFSDFL